MARVAEQRLGKFNAQELANTVWAFVTVDQQDEQLFKAVAKMAERRLDHFIAQDLANTAWALTDSAALHARELLKRSSRGGSWGGWVEVIFYKEG